ncbi:BLUF domain-containing protein [Pseudoduganella chitinolytica]|uniref:BLUF domain-containing protein n=1 Tax=Pseudoduganella chitinolytica TaxID=34070 RepID=A0ABY8B8P9_9BURK|nr:BLUF domain-containing protein [Pseudoduganella chitinolytica]WEF31413.1 BLUF domain-containing protein [Pseudoduganella chitinolytica]
MSLNQLVYISQATRKMSKEELLDLLAQAKANNARIDVTGSLFYNGGWFMQVLEGPEATLAKLVARIENDPRHQDFRLLYNEPAKFRTFVRWSMNMTNLEDRQTDKYDELVDVIEAAKTDRKIGTLSPAVTLLRLFSH